MSRAPWWAWLLGVAVIAWGIYAWMQASVAASKADKAAATATATAAEESSEQARAGVVDRIVSLVQSAFAAVAA